MAAVKRRDHGRCQATVHVAGCDGVGTDVDHVVQGDDHALSNLRLLSNPCHVAKTQADRPQRRRPPEAHPGLL